MKNNILFFCDSYYLDWVPNLLNKLSKNYVCICYCRYESTHVLLKKILNKNIKTYCLDTHLFENKNRKYEKDYIDKIEKNFRLNFSKVNFSQSIYNFFYGYSAIPKEKQNKLYQKRAILTIDFFNNIIKKHSINIVFNEHIGGFASSVLQQICKNNKINSYFFQTYFFQNKFFLTKTLSFDYIMFQKNLSNIYFKYNKIDKDYLFSFKTAPIEEAWRKKFIKRNFFIILKEFLFKIFPYYRLSKEDNFLFNRVSPQRQTYGKIKSKIENYCYNKFITKKLNNNDLKNNYFLYLLHVEPELSTYAMGGFNFDQGFVIKNIIRSLPTGYKLLIKEHGSQVLSAYSKSYSFYKEISKLPNVKFIQTKEGSLNLIKNSKAVFTISGTAGLEGIAFNKAVFLFGEAMYQNHPNVFKVSNIQELPEKINKFLNFFKGQEEEEIDRYLSIFKETMFDGNIYPTAASKLSKEQNDDMMEKTFIEILKLSNENNI